MTRVLVVDDKEENLYYLQALLTGHGHEVELARHGAEALSMARRTPPGLVVSDLLMPVMDGYTLLRQWKVDERLKLIPFIVYTATYTEPADEQLAYDLGADAFILKPAEPEEFLTRISAVRAATAPASAHPNEPSADETDLLKTYSTTLIRKLEEKTLQLEESNRALTDLADERAEAADALRRALAAEQLANEELRGVSHLRSSFLTAVSHEIRTPLTIVLGLAESLDRHDGMLGTEQRLELTRRLQVNAQRLGTLLDDLLDLNDLADGRLRLERRRHDLRELVVEAAAQATTDGRPVAIDVPPIEADVDPVRLGRVVVSLLENANVHTPAGTPIEVVATGDETQVLLRVIDHGPGIPLARRELVFEAFEQGPSVPQHRPGTGIGLSLARDFVRLHDGRLWVEETPGGGATFVVEVSRFLPDEP